MTAICNRCEKKATVRSKFYNIRITDSGKDDGIGTRDEVLCEVCLLQHIEEKGVKNIQSMIRIEEPTIA